MIEYIFLLILFIPTFIANAVPVIIKNIYFLKNFNKPVNEKIFGKNKTYRGFISGIISAILISIVIFAFLKNFGNSEIITKYYEIIFSYKIAILSGFLQGFGALFGDIIESFIKRKIGKKPGEAWPFWDGVDYIIGAIIFFAIIFIPSPIGIIFLILFAPLISLIANITAYFLGIKNVWY